MRFPVSPVIASHLFPQFKPALPIEADARAIQLFLTEEGRTRAQEIDERRKVVAEDVFAMLSDQEKKELAAIMGKLQAELDKYRPRHHGEPEPAEE